VILRQEVQSGYDGENSRNAAFLVKIFSMSAEIDGELCFCCDMTEKRRLLVVVKNLQRAAIGRVLRRESMKVGFPNGVRGKQDANADKIFTSCIEAYRAKCRIVIYLLSIQSPSRLLLLLPRKQRVHRRIKVVPPFQESQLQHENICQQCSSCLLDELTCCSRRPSRSNNIIYHNDPLSLLDDILLNLEEVLTILLLKASCLDRTRQLALLPQRHECATQAKGQAGSEEEPSGFKAYNDVWLLAFAESGGDVDF